MSRRCNSVPASVYESADQSATEAAEEWGEAMQAGAPGTHVQGDETARELAQSNGASARKTRRGYIDRAARSESASAPALRLQPVPPQIALQRARKLVIAAEAVRAEDNKRGSEACQLEAFDQALALAAQRAGAAFYTQDGWLDAVRAGLTTLLEFFDEEPGLARYLVVHSAQASGAVLTRRREVLDRIAELLDHERAPARAYPPPLTALAVVNGVLGVLSERLGQSRPGQAVELAAPLMSFTVLPFLGVKAARRELAAARGRVQDGDGGLDALEYPAGRLNPRASLVLSVIAAEPRLNSREVAYRARINDEGQASRLLARLRRLGLIADTRAPGMPAGKAWELTAQGEKVHAAIVREASAPAPASAFGLPEQFAGRLDDRAVLMLRVIAGQPWLRSSEVAERAGVEDRRQAASLLDSLLSLGLAASERESHHKGTPKVWRITPAGEELDAAIGRDAPAPPRSVALELLWESGGRLSDAAVAVLRTVGAEPGLSNNDIAARVGITDENSMSQLLARLARRQLAVNTRTGGKYNVWQLTPAGEKLERAIWHETPEPEQRKLALGLLRDRGGRLNHRVVAVLRAIGAEPELCNKDIAARVGIEAKGHASTLLTRLARFGLIKNLVVDPLPFEANAWVLTPTREELAKATSQPSVSLPTEPAESE
jgi:DNA-binding MarR family transcriptional regulator